MNIFLLPVICFSLSAPTTQNGSNVVLEKLLSDGRQLVVLRHEITRAAASRGAPRSATRPSSRDGSHFVTDLDPDFANRPSHVYRLDFCVRSVNGNVQHLWSHKSIDADALPPFVIHNIDLIDEVLLIAYNEDWDTYVFAVDGRRPNQRLPLPTFPRRVYSHLDQNQRFVANDDEAIISTTFEGSVVQGTFVAILRRRDEGNTRYRLAWTVAEAPTTRPDLSTPIATRHLVWERDDRAR